MTTRSMTGAEAAVAALEAHGVDMVFGIAVCDRCNLGYWAFRCMPAYAPRTFQYPMGYGVLAAICSTRISSNLLLHTAYPHSAWTAPRHWSRYWVQQSYLNGLT